MCKKETMQADCHEDNDKDKDGSTAEKNDVQCHPRRPFSNFKEMEAWFRQRAAPLANSRATDIIFPDPTPESVRVAFREICHRVVRVMEKDNVRGFLDLFKNGRGMGWGFLITPVTFHFMITPNALRCAKVALEGKAPELNGHRANPNCMNPYGYFPLHEAAERFSVDMIKLLFSYGASANLRTSNDAANGNLLPLHVAIENTCLHKYLEDNILSNEYPRDYMYKLIHLLCLPEMKIFLDTTRLLAKKTDNLVDELWNYMKDGKLVQSAVLLLAAQEQIRGGHSSKRNGNGKKDGFDIIRTHIVEHSVSLSLEIDKNGKASKQMKEKRRLLECAEMLVVIISQAGEALDAYIQAHSEMRDEDVLEHVSSILKDYGFFPTGDGIDVRNLRSYDCKMYDQKLRDKYGDTSATKAATEMAYLHAAEGKATRKKLPRGWDPTYSRRSFIPYWRSVLASRFTWKVIPPYASEDSKNVYGCDKTWNSWIYMRNTGYPTPNHNLGLLGTSTQLKSNRQSRRVFGTAAFALLRVLKNA